MLASPENRVAPPPFQVQEVAVHLATDTEDCRIGAIGAVAIPSMHRAGFFPRLLSFQTGKNQNRLGLRFLAGLEIEVFLHPIIHKRRCLYTTTTPS